MKDALFIFRRKRHNILMCRLFGVIAVSPLDASFPLYDAPQSLFKQSIKDPRRPQKDGWGVGAILNQEPRVYKSPQPISRRKNAIQRAGREARGHALVGHVRSASNPLKLPRRQLIGRRHTQPFHHGGWLFVHNGTLNIPQEVKKALGSWGRHIKGNNDSEVLFHWLLKTVVYKKGPFPLLVRASLGELNRLWRGCRQQYPQYTHPYHGLNWVLTNGRRLIAFCYGNAQGWGPNKAFYSKRQPYFQLQWRKTPGAVAVASERLDKKPGWEGFSHGQLLVVDRGTTLRVRKSHV